MHSFEIHVASLWDSISYGSIFCRFLEYCLLHSRLSGSFGVSDTFGNVHVCVSDWRIYLLVKFVLILIGMAKVADHIISFSILFSPGWSYFQNSVV
jgi:hypothetical protein